MGQTITATANVRDDAAAFSLYAAQATNYIDYSTAKTDGSVLILVKNTNSAVNVETATITISPAPAAAIGPWQRDEGTLTFTVADGNSMKTLGPLSSARFKGTNGLITVNVALTQGGTVSSVQLGVVNKPK